MKLSAAVVADVENVRRRGYVVNRSPVCYEMTRRTRERWRRFVRTCHDCPIRFGSACGCFDKLEAIAAGRSAREFEKIIKALEARGD